MSRKSKVERRKTDRQVQLRSDRFVSLNQIATEITIARAALRLSTFDLRLSTTDVRSRS
jgi:biotin operon repressor